MRVLPKVYALHKSGNAVEEYEDAHEHGWAAERDEPSFRCAVADGATEASFSKLWANKLVRAYCAGEIGAPVLAARLEGLQQEWLREVSASAAAQQQWYVEEKLRQGAFSALVGLTLQPAANGQAKGRWNAVAIGDCCLFQVRRDALLVRFPIGRAEDFNNRPFLLSSNPAGNNSLVEHTHPFTGTWGAGDCFYLASDAMAQWFLQTYERGQRPWHTLAGLRKRTDDAFASLVAELRASNELRNDDVTVLEVLID